MNKEKFIFLYFILLMILIAACSQNVELKNANGPSKEIAEPKIETTKIVRDNTNISTSNKPSPILEILYPLDGALIQASKLTVEVNAKNFRIVPVGSPVKDGEGHFHVWLDSEKKLGTQTSFTFENIISGKHTISAELVMSNHSSLSPRITKTINVNFESNYKPEQLPQQSGLREYTVEADDYGFYPSKITAKINETLKINFKFRDENIYFAGLDVKGSFPTLQYKLKGAQPLTTQFVVKDETKITSYWPSSGVRKADLIVEIER